MKKEFAENRERILTEVKAAAEKGDDARVVELAEKFGFIHDPELEKYLVNSHAVLKAKEQKERAVQDKADALIKAEQDKAWENGYYLGFVSGAYAERSGRMKLSSNEVNAAARGIIAEGSLGELSDDARRSFISGFESGYDLGWSSSR